MYLSFKIKGGECCIKVVKVRLPHDLENVRIIPLADLHIGDGQCNKKLINDLIEDVKIHDNTYCILGGDLMNTALTTSVSDTYGETIPPMDQIKRCIELFEPIKEKILAVVGGNHESRTYKTSGINITALMCGQLGILDRYSDNTIMLFVYVGRHQHSATRQQCYSFYITHGSGGGRKWGGKINRLVDYSNIVDTDIYICGHTHSPAIVRQQFFRAIHGNGTVSIVDKLFVNTASSLDYGGYGDVFGYTPGSNKYPVIILDGTKKKAEAIL